MPCAKRLMQDSKILTGRGATRIWHCSSVTLNLNVCTLRRKRQISRNSAPQFTPPRRFLGFQSPAICAPTVKPDPVTAITWSGTCQVRASVSGHGARHNEKACAGGSVTLPHFILSFVLRHRPIFDVSDFPMLLGFRFSTNVRHCEHLKLIRKAIFNAGIEYGILTTYGYCSQDYGRGAAGPSRKGSRSMRRWCYPDCPYRATAGCGLADLFSLAQTPWQTSVLADRRRAQG